MDMSALIILIRLFSQYPRSARLQHIIVIRIITATLYIPRDNRVHVVDLYCDCDTRVCQTRLMTCLFTLLLLFDEISPFNIGEPPVGVYAYTGLQLCTVIVKN